MLPTMSKKIEDSELQTLTLSPTNTNDDENSPFINPASDETAFPISPPSYSMTTSSSTLTGERRKVERMSSAPGNSSTTSTTKPIPTLRVSTPPGLARISYTNERSNNQKLDLNKISRDRPTPTNSIGQKKDTLRYPDISKQPSITLTSGASNPRYTPQTLENHGENSGTASNTKKISQDVTESNRTPSFTTASEGSVFVTPGSQNIHLPPPPSYIAPGGSGGSTWGRLGGVRGGFRTRGIGSNKPRQVNRPVQHHTFHADVADVRQIEQGLLQLMEDFQAGNLRAFGKDSRLRQMEAIREQQEKLAKLHFDVGVEQDVYPLSEDGLRTSHDNMRMLMENLAKLSESIERLHTNTSGDRRSATTAPERKFSSTSNQPSQPSTHHHHHHSRHHHHHRRINEQSATPHHSHLHQHKSKTDNTSHHHNTATSPHHHHHNTATSPHHHHHSTATSPHHQHNSTTIHNTVTTPHHHNFHHTNTSVTSTPPHQHGTNFTPTTTTTIQHASPSNPRQHVQGRMKTTPAPQPKNGKVLET